MTSSGFHQALLGFDVRDACDPGATWDGARRDLYLLRGDAPRPLSVDVRVWPGLFDTVLSPPAWTGPNQGLWEDLFAMREALGPLGPTPSPAWTVAVGWVAQAGVFQPTEWGPFIEPVTPSSLGAEWTLLGFDVADAGFISGLSNCGYEPAERAELRAVWAASLNEHHLFRDVERALAFRTLSDERVADHAPFFVYSLYRLDEARERLTPHGGAS
jgi:hypothetical protein